MAVSLAGLALSAYGAFTAGDAASAAQQQDQLNKQAQLDWNKQQDPFSAGGNRQQYVPQLNQLMAGGAAGVANDPMFQKQNQQSQQDMQRRMASHGQGASGQEMIGLQQNSWKNQQDYFNQQYTRLSELSGASRGGGGAATGQSPSSVYDQRQGTQTNLMDWLGMGSKALSSMDK